MTAMPRPAPPPPTPPPHPPALRLPRERRRPGGTAASVLLHGTLLIALVWRGAQLLSDGAGAGPRGGGGGGGGPAVHYFTLPAPAAASASEVPEPRVVVSDLPVPDPVAIKLPPIDLAPVTPPSALSVAGTGTATGPGSGPGTGGGQGAGTGPGAGSGVGPGRGGGDGYIVPHLDGMVLAPQCAPHGHYEVRFWVGADGKVRTVAVEPQPKDASCRRDFVDRMMAYRFTPASQNGQPVPSVYTVKLSQ
jgi:hypothetical protein